MKKILNKILILGFIMLFAFSIKSYAATQSFKIIENKEMTYINPLYPEITEDDLVKNDTFNFGISNEIKKDGNVTENDVKNKFAESNIDVNVLEVDDSQYSDTVEGAAAVLREGLVNHEATINVYYKTDSSSTTSSIWNTIFYASYVHTGVPTEGDYIRWQYAGINGNITSCQSGSTYYWNLTYTVTYYTTAEQEEEVSAQIIMIINQDSFINAQNEYEKAKAIYDYITSYVSYDYTNLNNSSYTLKYTAYAALINHSAVCQGYALLFYRLALEEGLSARLVAGCGSSGSYTLNHGWNIVKVGDYYYDLDSTWDAGNSTYKYFLLCENSFKNGYIHYRADEYNTTDFNTAYPMSSTNFDYDTYMKSFRTGVYEEDGVYNMYKDGQIDTSYTGMYTTDRDVKYYFEKGVGFTGTLYLNGFRYKFLNGIVDYDFTGVYEYNNGNNAVYLTTGVTDYAVTGLYTSEEGNTWYITGGVANYTGTMYINGYRYKFVNGKVDTGFTGVYEYNNEFNAVYLAEGKTNYRAYGLYTSNEGNTWYITGGVANFTGTIYTNGFRYKFVNGKVDTDFTGVYEYNNGFNAVYLTEGKTDYRTYGLYTSNEGNTWYITGGVANYTGTLYTNGFRYKFVNGKVDTDFTGVYEYNDGFNAVYLTEGKTNYRAYGLYTSNKGNTWYITGGVANYTGTIYTNGFRYKFVNGKVDTSFTGVYEYNDGNNAVYLTEGKTNYTINGLYESKDGNTWYITGGVANYTGTYTDNDGQNWNVVNGKATKVEEKISYKVPENGTYNLKQCCSFC